MWGRASLWTGWVVPHAPRRGHLWVVALSAEGELSIDLVMLYCGPLHDVTEVPIHRLRFWLARLWDGSEHLGRCGDVLCGFEEILCDVIAFSELVTHLLRTLPFGFEAPPLDIVVDTVKLLHEGVELLLLLTERGLSC